MEEKNYLVKFTKSEHYPNFDDLKTCSVKVGTFHHFRKIEDEKFKDEKEGQDGLKLMIKKPCSQLIKLCGDSILNFELDEKGEFKIPFQLFIEDVAKEFNCWMFCVSRVNNLEEIEKIKEYFKCDSYFFIKDFDKFQDSIQKALQQNLIEKPNNELGESRVINNDPNLYYLGGHKQPITYFDLEKSMTTKCNTLTEFYYPNTVNLDFWFCKREKFKIEQEFRFLFYATADSTDDNFYSTIDDYVKLNCDLTDCISETPVNLKG